MLSQTDNAGGAEEALRIFENALSCWNIALTDIQRLQFRKYASLLVEWNSTRMNLTRLTSPREIAIQHFLDSVAASMLIDIPENARVLDIGCGAGFPGLALKILRPGIALTLMDATAKKLSFCEAVAQELDLTQIDFVHGRAEELGKSRLFRGIFNIATARAVASLDKLLPWGAPFVSRGGVLAAWKGPAAEEEMQKAAKIARKYGMNMELAEISLPDSGEPPRFHRLALCRRED